MTKQPRKKPSPQPQDKSPHDGERIAKVMARAGLCSRRDAESWIAEGRVTVNGEKISSPALNVTASDKIAVDGKPLPKAERTRLFLYHKPRGLVTTHADPEQRPTIFEKLPGGLPRLISVGRLDLNTEGLLLLTNDGGLARALELPQTGWLRRYRVRANGRVTQPQLDALRKGVTVDGIHYGAIEATLDREQGANVWLTFAIREGKNREVRNVLEHLGLKVNRLIRISFGPFQLGDLDEGKVEEVRTRHLREQLGERIAAEAGVDLTGPMNTPAPSPQASEARPPKEARLPRQERSPRHESGRAERPSAARAAKPSGRPKPDSAPRKQANKKRDDFRQAAGDAGSRRERDEGAGRFTSKPRETAGNRGKRRGPSGYKGKRDR